MLTVICGPMFSEKSTTLHRYVSRALRAKKRVDVVVPTVDTRSKGQVVTHSGLTLESLGVAPRTAASSADLYRAMPLPAPDLMVIEEAQFFDIDLPMWVGKLVEQGIHVVAAGLDLTSEGGPFGPMGHLMCLADRVEKLTAICACGAEATRTKCRVKKDGDVLVGGGGEYVPACLACWVKRPR
jgi:thymidine kinase